MASVTLGEFNEPQPDIVIAHPRCLACYERPEMDDIFALVEVADSALRTDMGFKRDLYARYGVKDYLVVDVNGLCLRRFHSPTADGYSICERLSREDAFALIALPDVPLDVARFLPPA